MTDQFNPALIGLIFLIFWLIAYPEALFAALRFDNKMPRVVSIVMYCYITITVIGLIP